jgi:hypothetical protein
MSQHSRFMSRVLSVSVIAIAIPATAAAQSAPNWPSGKPFPTAPFQIRPSEAKRPETKPAVPDAPIVFFVARGEPNACGPGCQEWIAAEGTFDSDAEPRLWELLRKLGDRKLPIYFHSRGGSVAAGLELGRLIRQHGLTAGVGRTVPADCDRKDPHDEACDALKRSGRELVAEFDTLGAICASSCVYTLLGGMVREVGVGARLGVHDTFMPLTIRSADADGHITDVPLQLTAGAERKQLQAGYELIGAYLHKMGISPGLMTSAHATPPERLRFLTREEIVAFGIDRRDAVEDAWSFVDQPAGASAVKLIEATDAEAGGFRTTMLSLSCRDKSTVRLQYAHEFDAGNERPSGALQVTTGGRSFPLMRLNAGARGDSRLTLEKHGAELPLSALDDATFVVESAGQGGSDAQRPVHLKVATAGPALGALARRCRSGSF